MTQQTEQRRWKVEGRGKKDISGNAWLGVGERCETSPCTDPVDKFQWSSSSWYWNVTHSWGLWEWPGDVDIWLTSSFRINTTLTSQPTTASVRITKRFVRSSLNRSANCMVHVRYISCRQMCRRDTWNLHIILKTKQLTTISVNGIVNITKYNIVSQKTCQFARPCGSLIYQDGKYDLTSSGAGLASCVIIKPPLATAIAA